ncbi:MAG TPA: hypothetical protein PKD67_07485 [Ignavibacteriaceae bacterium]|jgi:tetratricopeptide (TPR) repeat protein|nr:hypothetical protein [Ignavibacteriaceae bacterium]
MEYFSKAIGQPIQYPELRIIFSRYYNIKGANKADEGKLDEALENFNKAIELNPLCAVALFNRATIKADLGDFEGAKEDFLRAKCTEYEISNEAVPTLREIYQDEISGDNINFF